MNKKLYLIFMAVILILLLSGCQLARVNGVEKQNGVRLVGAFITQNYLELSQFEGMIIESSYNIFGIRVDEKVDIPNPPSYYDHIVNAEDGPRLYATLNENKDGNVEYVFDGVEGVPLFFAKYPGGTESYGSASSDLRIGELHMTDSDSFVVEGTIYLDPTPTYDETKDNGVLYTNPVFQSDDGRVYLKAAGIGMWIGYTDSSTGLTETHTVTGDGKIIAETISTVKVNLKRERPSKNISVIQINDQNTSISQEQYTLDALPENIEIGTNTKYVIIERRSTSSYGKNPKREIFSRDDQYFTCYKSNGDGFLELVTVDLLWGK